MLKRFNNRLHIWVPLLILAAALFLRYQEPPMLERLRNFVFDGYQQLYPREFQKSDSGIGVRIVDIDDESLGEIGQWPWSRVEVANLVLRLKQMGALVVVFDIVFAEPDRTSPPVVAKDWEVLEGAESLVDQIRTLPDFDQVFASYIEQLNPVVMGFSLSDGERGRTPKLRGNFAFKGPHPKTYLRTYKGAIANIPVLEEAASGNGSFNYVNSVDGVVRRVPVLVSLETPPDSAEIGLYPSLTVEALRTIQGVKTMKIGSIDPQSSDDLFRLWGMEAVQIGQLRIPVDQKGHIWLYSTGHRAERFVSARDVLSGVADPEKFANHIVFVGTSAPGLRDQRPIALSPVYDGVEIHAEITEQVLNGQYLSRPDWAPHVEGLFILVLGGVLIVLMPRIGVMGSAIFGGVLCLGAIGASIYAFANFWWMIDPVFPTASTLGVHLAGSAILFVRTESEKRQIRGAFTRYLSPDLVEQLAREPDRLKLGGETKVMTFLFCDVRGFTTISESFKGNPQGLTHLINRFLTPLTDRILERKGTIDKYMGDCIMAFWNAPLDVADHEKRAAEAALAMFASLDDLNEERRREAEDAGDPFLPLNIGIGINTGDCVVGNMGSDQRFDYSVLGDAVNLASRLEGQSKGYGVGIVLGPETAAAISEDFAVIELDLIAVKGKAEAVRVFALLGDREMAESAEFQDVEAQHDRMLNAYRNQDWDGADALLDTLGGCLDGRLSGLHALYRDRTAAFRENPPRKDWDGVFVAISK